MAPRVTPAPTDADNSSGSAAVISAPAHCSDWRAGARRFHVGTGHPEPTHDAGYTTAGAPSMPALSISLFLCEGSPYTDIRLQALPQCQLCRSASSFVRGVHIRGVRLHLGEPAEHRACGFNRFGLAYIARDQALHHLSFGVPNTLHSPCDPKQ